MKTTHITDETFRAAAAWQAGPGQSLPFPLGALMIEAALTGQMGDQVRFQPEAMAARWGWPEDTVREEVEAAKVRVGVAMRPKALTVEDRWVERCVERRRRAPSTYWSVIGLIKRDYRPYLTDIHWAMERMLTDELPANPVAYLIGIAKKLKESGQIPRQDPPVPPPTYQIHECRGQSALAGCPTCQDLVNERSRARGVPEPYPGR